MVRKIAAMCFALMLLVPSISSCNSADSDISATAPPQDEKTSSPEVQSVSDAQQGNDSKERYIINSEGGYRLTLPEDWMGKVTYKTESTSTIIHHVTHDSAQPEQNPIVVNIGMTESGKSYDGQSFMEIGSNIFYYIPLFDLPYNQDSEDAKEFLSLHEQTLAMLNTLELVSDISQDKNQNESQAPAPQLLGTPFNENDTYFANIHLGDSKEDVIAKIGQPKNSSQVTWEGPGGILDVNEYSFAQLIFVEDKLVLAQMYDDTYSGPRGIKVGMDLNDVLSIFSNSVEYDDDNMTVLYRANQDDDYTLAVPPCGVLHKGELQTLVFSDFTSEGGGKDMSLSELSDGSYRFLEQYTLICEFDPQNTLLRYSVSVGAPSE